MKKLIFLALLLCSCAAYSKGNAKLSGKITNPISDSIHLRYSLTCIASKPNEYGAKLDKNGRFKMEFTLPEGYTSVIITHGDQETELFAQPGADLSITLDAKSFDSTLRYDGKGKEIANFMSGSVLAGNTLRYFSAGAQKLCAKEPDEFEAALKEYADKEIDYLDKTGAGLPESFKTYFKTDCRYSVYCAMQKYPNIHEMYRNKSNSVKGVPKANYKVIDDIPEAFNDDYLNIQSYKSYLNNFYALQISAENSGISTPANKESFMDSLLNRVYRRMPPKSAELTAGQRIFYAISYTPIEKTEREYEAYKARFPDSKNLAILRDAIFHEKNMGPGKPAIDFDITTPDRRTIKLSDLKENVVYIDFWSRSCVPCLGEMPEAKKIRDHFKDKAVKFVYISLDPDNDTWKKAIKDYEVDGINMRVDKEWQSALVKKYGVSSIPSHFLIDKAGKFVAINEAGESENLIEQIENLLKSDL